MSARTTGLATAEHRMRVDFEFPNHFLTAICGMSITLHQKVID